MDNIYKVIEVIADVATVVIAFYSYKIGGATLNHIKQEAKQFDARLKVDSIKDAIEKRWTSDEDLKEAFKALIDCEYDHDLIRVGIKAICAKKAKSKSVIDSITNIFEKVLAERKAAY